MNSFEQSGFALNQEQLPSEHLRAILRERILIEDNPNFKHAITTISEMFSLGVASTDKKAVQDCLRTLESYESYLSEKYRHTQDERLYINYVGQAITLLQKKIKESSQLLT